MAPARASALSAALALAGAIALAAAPARGQDYPAKPIKIIVPLAPGGLADTLARIVAQRLGEASGQTVVVENRPGGAGAVGAEAAARAPADGYTLFMGGLSTNAVLAHLTRLAFDPAKDLVPVIHVATFPNMLVVNPGLPAKSVAELVAHAKANPGKLSYASQGNAASGHLVGEQFKQLAGIEMVHVPYRGAAPAVQDLIAGHVQVMFDSVMLQRPLVADGKTRALAVLTPKRIDSLPDVATMTEAGFGQMQSGTWFGMLAPAGTPAAAIAWVNRETRNAFAPEQVRQRYLSQGTLLPLGSPDDFAAHIAAERERWGEVIRKANIKLSE
jgi:tripartite-type tricarboxylate transporter receptor subunit TctC